MYSFHWGHSAQAIRFLLSLGEVLLMYTLLKLPNLFKHRCYVAHLANTFNSRGDRITGYGRASPRVDSKDDSSDALVFAYTA